MRVEERLTVGGARPGAETAEAQKVRTAHGDGRPGGSAGADTIELSGLAGLLRGALEDVAGAHQARVERVAAEVQSGRYRVDVSRLSGALASEALG